MALVADFDDMLKNSGQPPSTHLKKRIRILKRELHPPVGFLMEKWSCTTKGPTVLVSPLSFQTKKRSLNCSTTSIYLA